MSLVALVALLIIIQYFIFTLLVGAARTKTGIEAPAVTGDPDFERAYRVQQNTLEQLMLVLPALWLCATYFRSDVAAICGSIFIVGRFIYRAGYVADPKKRGLGMGIGMLATVAMALCSAWGIIISLI